MVKLLQRRVSAYFVRENLHLYVRQSRHVDDLGQLSGHDLAPANHPVQRRFVENNGEAGRVGLGEDALPGEFRLDLPVDLFGIEPGHGTLVISPCVVGGVEETMHHR
jgi:hypothetical protein